VVNVALGIVAVVALGLLGGVLWVRLAPSDPARWHVDPATAPDPETDNFARADQVIPLPPEEVRARLDRIAAREGAVVLAEDPGRVTYIARTRRMRFPDYVSLRLDAAGEGATRLQALSRARFGSSDGGVNAARLRRWLRKLEG
jgi:uncharacterized protein (DUF1499 family)